MAVGAVPAHLDSLITALTVLATAVLAASAAIQAVRSGFDLFGGVFLSVTAAVGGGTLRDLLIGATPVFWLQDILYLGVAAPVGLVTCLLARKLKAGGGRRARLLNYLDAIGLALFTLVGIQVSLAHGLAPHFAVVMGCITGVAGGMARDMLCGRTPLVLRKDIYASLSLLGGVLFVVLHNRLSEEVAVAIAFTAIAVSRIIVIVMNRETDGSEPEK